MKKIIAFVAAAGLALVGTATTSFAAYAQSTLQKVLSRGELIVGTGDSNPPWHFKDDKGTLVGFDIDIAKILAKGLFNDPNKVTFVTQSDDSRIPNLVTDKVDITCQFLTVTAGRAQQVAFTVPYYREGVGLLLRKGGSYTNYAELKKAGSSITVAVLQNVYADDMVHEALPNAQVDQYSSPNLIYQALNSGRADAAATDASSVRWILRQNPDQYLDSGYYWDPQSYACAVRQGDQVWLNYVNTALLTALTGVDFPEYAAAFQHWFGTTPPPPQIGFPQEYR
jgi:polar amino acid transport system substrate-binding protein